MIAVFSFILPPDAAVGIPTYVCRVALTRALLKDALPTELLYHGHSVTNLNYQRQVKASFLSLMALNNGASINQLPKLIQIKYLGGVFFDSPPRFLAFNRKFGTC